MADKFWKGGGASTNWNAVGNTNWADTDGGANNATAPGVGDKVFFTALSGSGTSVLNTAFTVQALNCTGYTGTLTHNGSTTLTINTASVDSLILSSTMTYTPVLSTALITFTNTSGNADITSNGKRLGSLTINGVGGTARILDALRVDTSTASILTLTNGTFNANGFAVTTNSLSSSNSNTRSLLLGGGDWTVGSAAPAGTTIWTLATTTGLTFTKGASNIIIPTNSSGGARTFAGGGLTYNDVTVNQNSARGMVIFTGANTFANLPVGAGNALSFPNGTTVISGAPTWTGTTSLPILVEGGSPGTTSTLSIPSGTLTLDYGGVRDMIGLGGATFIATNSFDYGQNTGWAITPPAGSLTAADIRTAVGLASANLDTQLDALPTANESADALLDRAAGIETGLTPRQGLRLMAAALFGKATGFDTGSVVYRDTGDTKNRISSAVTAAGRGAPTLDAS